MMIPPPVNTENAPAKRSCPDGKDGDSRKTKKRKRSNDRWSLNESYLGLEEQLIKNYFSQLKELNEVPVKRLRRASRSFQGEVRSRLQNVADCVLDIPTGTYREQYDIFNESLNQILGEVKPEADEVDSGRRKTETLNYLHDLCADSYIGINARGVHQAAFRLFTEPGLSFRKSEVDKAVDGIPEHLQTPLIKYLAETWSRVKRKSGNLKKYSIVNIPNQAFDLVHGGDCSKIGIIRMESPELCPAIESIKPQYRSMMESYQRQDKRHMDVSLVSLSYFEHEIIVSELRHELQYCYPETLLSWASDAYSDFALQRGSYKITKSTPVSTRVFIGDFLKKIMNKSELSFIIPESYLNGKSFKNDMQKILNNVLEDVFYDEEGSMRYLSDRDRQDFVVIAVVYMIEYFCSDFSPDSLDTACRAHIDRGMVMTTALYLYCLIKCREINEKDYLEYVKLLVFPPSLLFARRPTHAERIKRLLSVISRFQDPEVIRRISARKTLFSDYTVKLPAAK